MHLKNIGDHWKEILICLIAVSVAARFAFILVTPVDSWSTDSSNHARIIKEIAETDSIPSYDHYISDFFFWAPPFYHLISAVFYKVASSFLVMEGVSLVFGVLSVPLCYLTFKQMAGKEKALLASFFVAVYPVAMRLSTSIMTDAATLFLTFLCIYAFFKFESSKIWKHGLLLLFSLALLILTKNIGVIVGGLMVIWSIAKRHDAKKYFAILLAAILIASPWYIRNYIHTNDFFGNPFWPFESSFSDKIGNFGRELVNGAGQYYTRFWDSVDISEFALRGIGAPTSSIGALLMAYLILAAPYFLLFGLGINRKDDASKFMILLGLLYVAFSFYYISSGWGLNFIPRVGIFALPFFCMMFANGVVRTKRYMAPLLLFLILTTAMFIGFEGIKQYTKLQNEQLYDKSYGWIRDNVGMDSLIVSNQWAQVSLFGERNASYKIPDDTSAYGHVYIYNRENSELKFPCNTSNCTLMYQDTYVNIYKI